MLVWEQKFWLLVRVYLLQMRWLYGALKTICCENEIKSTFAYIGPIVLPHLQLRH